MARLFKALKRRVLLVFVGCSMVCGGLYASWGPTAPIPDSVQTSEDVFPVYYGGNPSAVFAFWSNSYNLGYPTYATWDGMNWSASAFITTLSQANGDVYAAYDANNNTIVAVWTDLATYYPTYAIWDGTSWGAQASITTTSTATDDVFVVYDANNHTVIAMWADNATNYPTYAVWNGSSWSANAPITNASQSPDDVFAAYDANNHTVVAVWADLINNHYPTYAIWNGASWTTPHSTISTSSQVNLNVCATYDANTNTVMATWSDFLNHHYPTYATWNGASWSSTAVIVPSGAATPSQTYNDIYAVYNAANQTVVAMWGDFNSYPTYAIYDGANWTAVGPISTYSAVNENVYGAYDVDHQKVIATWGTGNTTYSLYDANSQAAFTAWNTASSNYPAFAIFPGLSPANGFTGQQKRNNFATVSELYNNLSWPSVAGASGYLLYRNGALIATLGASSSSYQDHDRKKSRPDTYLLIAFDSEGNTSAPVSVTVGH